MPTPMIPRRPYMSQLPLPVRDSATAVELVRWCVKEIGRGYHPDTPFGEYVDTAGQPCFSAIEAEILDAFAQAAFAHCDPYEVGAAELLALLSA
jgi:hypothetical protein